jgi:hypothetical protein
MPAECYVVPRLRTADLYRFCIRFVVSNNATPGFNKEFIYNQNREGKGVLMPRSIADSVIVITGASTGIGWAAALEFAQAGCSAAFFSRNLYLSKKSRRCVLGRLASLLAIF